MTKPQLASYMNTEVNAGNMSGLHYVSCRQKETPLKRGRIPIATPGRCGHINRICVDCAGYWYDHILDWERTGGGRILKAQLDRKAAREASREL